MNISKLDKEIIFFKYVIQILKELNEDLRKENEKYEKKNHIKRFKK